MQYELSTIADDVLNHTHVDHAGCNFWTVWPFFGFLIGLLAGQVDRQIVAQEGWV